MKKNNDSRSVRGAALSFLIVKLLLLNGTNTFAEQESGTVAGEETSKDKFGMHAEEKRALTSITITADPFGHNLLEHGSPATVVEKQELIRKVEPTLGETVGKEPGVSSSYFGPGSSRPIIRGNAGDRVRVLKNGVGTLDISNTSEDHAVTTNPLAAESIEILRGPETLLFGSSAIGGIVNVTDNSIPEEGIGEAFTGALDYRLGTGDDEHTGAITLEGEVERFNWHVDYFHQDTDDIDIPGFAESQALRDFEEAEGEAHEDAETEGTLLNSATRNQGGTVGASYVWSKGFVGISVSGTDSKYGVPGHAHGEEGHGHSHGDEEEHHDEDDHDEDHDDEHHDEDEHGHEDEDHDDDHDEDEHHDEDHDEDEHHDDDHDDEDEHDDDEHHEEEEGVSIDLKQLRVDVRGEVRKLSSAIEKAKFKLGLSTYEHKEIEDGAVGTKFENDALEGRLELTHAPLGSLEGVLGFQVEASDFSAVGDEAFLPQTDTFSPAVFLFEEYRLNEFWKLQAGARYDFVSYRSEGFSSDEFNPFGLSTGVVWDPTGTGDYSVALSFAYTQRAPSASELYANGAHVARQIFEVGDSELDLERSYGFDLTAKKVSGLITGSANVFVQDYDEYINLSGTAAEEEGFRVYNYESIRAFFWGFETEATLHLHEALGLWVHDLDLDAQVDFVRARNKSADGELPRIPPLRTIVGFDYRYKTMFGARVEGVFVTEQDRTAEFEIPTDNYELLNADVNFNQPLANGADLTFYVRGTNLTDEEARVHASFLKDLAPLRGRSVLFGVRGTF